MVRKSTLLFTYTCYDNQEETSIYDLSTLNPVDEHEFDDVSKYLDSLYVEAPEKLVKSLLERF